jgi:hypothetical protein
MGRIGFTENGEVEESEFEEKCKKFEKLEKSWMQGVEARWEENAFNISKWGEHPPLEDFWPFRYPQFGYSIV